MNKNYDKNGMQYIKGWNFIRKPRFNDQIFAENNIQKHVIKLFKQYTVSTKHTRHEVGYGDVENTLNPRTWVVVLSSLNHRMINVVFIT